MSFDLKPYPKYKDSGLAWLGKIPEHWELVKTKYLFRERCEKGFSDEPLLAATQTKGVVRKEHYENRTVLALKDLHLLKLVRPGDFVISLRSFQGGIEYAHHRGIISPAYTVLRPVHRANPGYYALLLKSRPYIDNLSVFVTGIRQGQNIDYERLSRSLLPVPVKDEQSSIADFLGFLDHRFSRYFRAKRRLIDLLNEEKQAIIQQAVTRGLDPNVRLKHSGVDWLDNVPEHWEARRLKTLLRPVDRRSSNGAETLLSLRRDHGVVVHAENFARPPQSASAIGYKIVEIGQLVVNRLQANNGLIFCSNLRGLVSPDYSVFEASSRLDMRFLGALLRTAPYRAHFRRESTGLGTGSAGFLRLYDDKLLETVVVLPPIHEQSRILASIDDETLKITCLVEKEHKELELLREYRARLITDVVTGKLDVRSVRLPKMEQEEYSEVWATEDDETMVDDDTAQGGFEEDEG